MVARAHERVPREELYQVAGIQTMAINTVFQLLADQRSSAPLLADTDRIALIPDLFVYWLTGVVANEATAASTTGLLDARSGKWAHEIVRRLGLPVKPFSRDPVEPGIKLGAVLSEHEAVVGPAVGVAVHTVAGHDTASAFAGTPLSGGRAAILSSGTC
jgi:rhamnulokinase